jgi:hypothetical protein
MNVHSAKLTVSLAPRKTVVIADSYVKLDRPVSFDTLKRVEYRLTINGIALNTWNPLPLSAIEKDTYPFAGLLFDSILDLNHQINIQFKYKGNSSIIEDIIIFRKEVLPTINSYRQLSPQDSIAHNSHSDFASRKKLKLEGLEYIQQNFIVVKPGKYPQLFINEIGENKDSCLQYRLRNLENNSLSDWKRTGHTVNLINVTANNRYIVEIRYMGMDTHVSYQINAIPFWHQKGWIRILLAILTISLSIMAYKLIRRIKLKNQHRDLALLAAELKNNRNKLDPHFIFNCLATAQSLIEEGKSAEASNYLDDFSDLLRGSLTNNHLEMISLSEEIEMIGRYIAIEQSRYRFRYIVSIDPDLNTESIQFPVMLLQPSIENAIKHGVAFNEQVGIISLNVNKKDFDLIITIMDNGDFSRDRQSSGTGNGVVITRDRIAHLQKLHPDSHSNYELINSPNGTIVRFTFENWL